MTINELLYDAIKYEETFLAYSLYWSLQQGYCKSLDDSKAFKCNLVDLIEINKLVESNPLGIKIMGLYSMPINKNHLIVLAENEASAKGHYLSEIGKLPSKIQDMTNKMDTSFWYGKGQGYKSFREIKENTLIFPSTVMEY